LENAIRHICSLDFVRTLKYFCPCYRLRLDARMGFYVLCNGFITGSTSPNSAMGCQPKLPRATRRRAGVWGDALRATNHEHSLGKDGGRQDAQTVILGYHRVSGFVLSIVWE